MRWRGETAGTNSDRAIAVPEVCLNGHASCGSDTAEELLRNANFKKAIQENDYLHDK